MVSQELAQQMKQTSEVKEQVRLTEEALAKQRRQIEATKFGLTKQERRGLTRQQIRLAKYQFQQAKSKILGEAVQQQQQFQIEARPVKSAIAESSRSIDIQIAGGYGRKLALRGIGKAQIRRWGGLKKYQQIGYDIGVAQLKGLKVRKELTEAGVSLITKRKLSEYGFYGPPEVVGFKRAGAEYPISAIVQFEPWRVEAPKEERTKKEKLLGEFYKQSRVKEKKFPWLTGKKNSPFPLQRVLKPVPPEILSMGGVASILPTTEAVPHMTSAGTQPIFLVGNTRNPKTWMNKDPSIVSKAVSKVKGVAKQLVTVSKVKGVTQQLVGVVTTGIQAYAEAIARKERQELLGERKGRIQLTQKDIPKTPFKEEPGGYYRRGAFMKTQKGKKPILVGVGPKEISVYVSPRGEHYEYKTGKMILKDPAFAKEYAMFHSPHVGAELIAKPAQERKLKQIAELKDKQITSQIQKEIDKGKITIKVGEEIRQKRFEKEMTPHYKQAEKSIQKSYERGELGRFLMARAVPTLATGYVLGGIKAVVPASKWIVGGIFGGYAGTHVPELASHIKKHPLVSILTVGAWSAGGYAGTVGTKNLMIKYGVPEISYANIRGLTASGTKRFPELSRNPKLRIREEARVIVKDKSGKVLYEIDRKTGMKITPGGDIKLKKGETARQSAWRELQEETSIKDLNPQLKLNIKSLKKVETVATARARITYYSLKINEPAKNIKLLGQTKEVLGFSWEKIKPGKYTGPSALQPFGKVYGPGIKGVRSQDLLIASREPIVIDIVSRISKMSKTSKGKLFSQSKKWAIKEFGAKRIRGISKQELAKDYLMAKEGPGKFGYLRRQLGVEAPIEQAFVRRGEGVFVERRVPKKADISVKKPIEYFKFKLQPRLTKEGVVFGRPPGTFYQFQRIPGAKIEIGSRYDIPYEQLKGYYDKPMYYVSATHKRFGRPGEVVPIVQAKRGPPGTGMYFHPPTQPGVKTYSPYVGAGYARILPPSRYKTPEYYIGFKPKGAHEPTFIYLKEALGKGLEATRKAIGGKEFEVHIPRGKQVKVIGTTKSIFIGGHRVRGIEIEILKKSISEAPIVKKFPILRELGMGRIEPPAKLPSGPSEWLPSSPYQISPLELVKLVPSEPIKITPSRIKPSMPSFIPPSPIVPSPPVRLPSSPFDFVPSRLAPSPLIKLPPSFLPSPALQFKPSRIFFPKEPILPSLIIQPSKLVTKKRRIEEKVIEAPAFKVFVKRKGKRVFLAGRFPRGEAIRIGERKARQTLRATFGIKEVGRIRVKRRVPEQRPSPEIFRTYRIVKGKRVPLKDVWIQKAPYRLSARGEVKEILQTKKRKGGKRNRWL